MKQKKVRVDRKKQLGVDMDNIIYVFLNKDNEWTLEFPKCNIKTNAYIGENGVTKNKKEGDGKTPLGRFELGIILGTHAKINNKNNVEYNQITKNLYWVDDYNSKYYNKLVDVSKVKKDWNSAEHLIEYKIQYEYLIEIKTNPRNIKGKGSAIFLHCSNGNKTKGCIAVNRNIMKEIVENIDVHTKIEIK